MDTGVSVFIAVRWKCQLGNSAHSLTLFNADWPSRAVVHDVPCSGEVLLTASASKTLVTTLTHMPSNLG